MRPRYAPYAGLTKPFSIGLKPLDPVDWIDTDDRLDADLAEKDRFFGERFGDVWRAESETESAQAEILDALWAYLPDRFSETYRGDATTLHIGEVRRVERGGEPPLLTAARLVSDDLVLMRRDQSGWRLVAAALCFPSSWSLAEKFGLPMADIHDPVPGFPGKMADRVERIFDHLRPDQPVIRYNWSLYDDDQLHHSESHQGRHFAFGGDPIDPARVFIRTERQTLRRMPRSGDILFTIKISVDPATTLARHPERGALAVALADEIEALNAPERNYKALERSVDGLARMLRALAAE